MSIKLNLFKFICILLILVLCFLGYKYLTKNNQNSSELFNLQSLEESTENIGYLYKITDRTSGQKYLTVSDTKINENILNSRDFSFEYKDVSYIWNPKSCAKMPSAIDSEGNLYMIDVAYENDRFVKKFIIYDHLNNEKKFFDVSGISIFSDLYIEENVPFFFVRKNDGVYKYNVIKQNSGLAGENKIVLESKNVFSIKNDDLVTVKKDAKGELVFTWFKSLTKKQKLIFDKVGNSLVEYTEGMAGDLQNDDGLVEASMLDKRRFENGVWEYRDSNNELDYGLFYDDKSVKKFLINSKGVYMYTINSF